MYMKNKYIIPVALIIIVTIGSLGYLSTQVSSAPGEYDKFAQCLTDNGATMYGAEWCGYCKKQKQMFGDSFQHINYVECPQNEELCSEKGVTGYPTWIINGETYRGLQELSVLASATGCEL